MKKFYIFLGLTIFGINKTPKTKSNSGAIIIKNDSIVIKLLKYIFLIYKKTTNKQIGT
tara:strand:+ start:397 stop:570 length:174 start_codon:yes stop_codon:yes gene_type:complete